MTLRSWPGRAAGVLRLLLTALPAWLVGVVLVPRTGGGTADPWDAPMGYGHALWSGAHALLRFAESYETPDPASGMVFPLSAVGAALGTVMGLGSWFAWQLLLLGVNACALVWLVRRLAGLLGGREPGAWAVSLLAAASAAALAPARAAMSQGSPDLLGLALALSAFPVPGVRPSARGRSWAGARLGLAAAVWLWPLVLLVPLVGARLARRRARRGGQRALGPLDLLGLSAVAWFVLLTLCALLVLPWDSTDFWVLLVTGGTGGAHLDPGLGHKAGLVGCLLAVLAGVVALALGAGCLRRRERPVALAWTLTGISLALPGHWAGQGVLAPVVAACAAAALASRPAAGPAAPPAGSSTARPRGVRPALVLVATWACWVCLWPADLPGVPAVRAVGALLGALALAEGVLEAGRVLRGRHEDRCVDASPGRAG